MWVLSFGRLASFVVIISNQKQSVKTQLQQISDYRIVQLVQEITHQYFKDYNSQQIKQQMNDENEVRKMRIHQLLNRHGFYRLPLDKLLEILRLLQVPEARQAKNIQQNAFAGLIRLEDTLKKPKNSSKSKNKNYFNADLQEKTSFDVRKLMHTIVQELLQSPNSKIEPAIISLPNQPNPSPLYPLMPLNPLGYSLKYPVPSKQQANMQMQMYYMNIYNYGTHPAMKISPQYNPYPTHSQPFPANQFQRFQRQPQNRQKAELKQAQFNQKQQQIQKEQQQQGIQKQIQQQGEQQMQLNNEQKMVAEQRQHVDDRISQEQVNADEQKHSQEREEQKSEMEAPAQAQPFFQHQIKKVTQQKQLQFQPIQNHIFPSQIIQKLNNQMKLVSKQIDIQTDLTLLNQMIQVFPRADLFHIHKKGNRTKRKHNKKKKQAQKSEAKNKPKQGVQEQKKKDESESKNNNQIEKKPKNEDGSENNYNNEKNTKVIKQFLITASKDFLLPINEEKMPEKLPQMIRQQSEFERLDRQMKQDLQKISKGKGLHENLRDCFCKGSRAQQSADIFECLNCKRMFHSSCLQYNTTTNIEQCHICKLQSYNSSNQVREVMANFYVNDDLALDFQKVIGISQYQYFLFQKIRSHQIELRCCKLNEFNNNQMVWPDNVALMVNGKIVFEIHALGKKKIKDAILLTQHIIQGNYDSLVEQSSVKIGIYIFPFRRDSSLSSNHKSLFAIGIYFVQRLQMEAFIDKHSKSIEPYTIDYLSKLMSIQNEKEDQQLQIEKVVCNLLDPFTKNIIKTPVRGSNCLHAQCFDLKTFLQFMYATKNRLWKCPVCSKQLRRLKIDQKFAQIIKRSLEQQTFPDQIYFMGDGRILLKISLEDDENDETPQLIKKVRKRDPQSVKKLQKIIKKED